MIKQVLKIFALTATITPLTPLHSTFKCFSSLDLAKDTIALHEIQNDQIKTIWDRLEKFKLNTHTAQSNPKPFYPGYFTLFGVGNKKAFIEQEKTNQTHQTTLTNFIKSGSNLIEFLSHLISRETAIHTEYDNITDLRTYATKRVTNKEESNDDAAGNWNKNRKNYVEEINQLRATIQIAQNQVNENKKLITENHRQFEHITKFSVRCNYLNKFCKLLVGQGFKKQLIYSSLLVTGFGFGTQHLIDNKLWKPTINNNFFKNPWSLIVPIVGLYTAKAWYKLMTADYYTPEQKN